MAQKTITLDFTLSDGTKQTGEFVIPLDYLPLAVKAGLTGDGTKENPLSVALGSEDKSVAIKVIEGLIDLSAAGGLDAPDYTYYESDLTNGDQFQDVISALYTSPYIPDRPRITEYTINLQKGTEYYSDAGFTVEIPVKDKGKYILGWCPTDPWLGEIFLGFVFVPIIDGVIQTRHAMIERFYRYSTTSDSSQFSGKGTDLNPLKIAISKKENNQLKTETGTTPGLFVPQLEVTSKDNSVTIVKQDGSVDLAAKAGGGLQPMVQINMKEELTLNGLNEVFNAAMGRDWIYDVPTTECYKVVDGGKSYRDAYITTYPVAGRGYYVFMNGPGSAEVREGTVIRQLYVNTVDGKFKDSILLRYEFIPTTVRTEYESLRGNGTTSDMLRVRLSSNDDNQIKKTDFGLYCKPTTIKSSDNSITVSTDDFGVVDLVAKAGSGGGGLTEVTVGSTALTGNGTVDEPLAIKLSTKEGNLLSAESGLLALAPDVYGDKGITVTKDDSGILTVEIDGSALHFGAGLAGDVTDYESPLKLKLTSSDASVTITEKDGAIDLAAKGGSSGGSSGALAVGSGITGSGRTGDPIQLSVSSLDKSIVLTEEEDGSVNFAVSDSLQTLMPALRPAARSLPLESGAFEALLTAYKADHSAVKNPTQLAYTATVESVALTPSFTIIPAVGGKYLFADGPVDESSEAGAQLLLGAYYISYTTTQAITTLWERKTKLTVGSGGSTETKSLTRSLYGGSFQIAVPDNSEANNACGKLGTGVYFKCVVDLWDAAPVGGSNCVPVAQLTETPCLENGELVPYNLVCDRVQRVSGSTPTVAVWLTLKDRPTHKIDRTTKTITALTRAPNVESGLPDYPETSGSAQNNVFKFTVSYYYEKTNA